MKSNEINRLETQSGVPSEGKRAKTSETKREPRSELLIVGYGNPLRGDDGVGWRVADELTKRAFGIGKILAVHQVTPELAEPIAEADSVIFIDACYEGQPGDWTCEAVNPDMQPSDAFSHYFTPAKLLSYASAIFGAKPRALLISVAAESFDCDDKLSPRVAAVVPELVNCVCEWWDANQEKPKR